MTAIGHAIWTVVLFIVFIGIVIWAYSRGRKKDFDEAARLALDDEEHQKRHGKPDDSDNT